MQIKRNLCVRTSTKMNTSNGFIRCKTIRPVRSLDEAREIAYRMIYRIPTAETVSIKLSPKGREESGTRYYFKKLHGKIECRVGSEFGGRPCKR